jgi:hypothetical protein
MRDRESEKESEKEGERDRVFVFKRNDRGRFVEQEAHA